MTYHHLTIEERIQIENMISLDFKRVEICMHLNLTPSTLSRELNRNSQPYNAYQAQERYQRAKARCGANTKLTSKLKEEIESIFNCPLYFAEPYSSWQRGTNENSNGLLRRFFPKGKCFSEISNEELLHATRLINFRPRKVLNFKTNDEKFQEYLLHLI